MKSIKHKLIHDTEATVYSNILHYIQSMREGERVRSQTAKAYSITWTEIILNLRNKIK